MVTLADYGPVLRMQVMRYIEDGRADSVLKEALEFYSNFGDDQMIKVVGDRIAEVRRTAQQVID